MALSFKNILSNFLKNIDTSTIDEFKTHISSSLKSRSKEIEIDYQSLSSDKFESSEDMEGYKLYLDDCAYFTDEMEKLSDEFLIMALYKQLELHVKKATNRLAPSIDTTGFFNVGTLQKELLKKMSINIKLLDSYAAFTELREINNSIKHQGVVSEKLAKANSIWVEGQELNNLSKTYERLKPEISKYVLNFVEELAKIP
ncbi:MULTISPECIES: hypothetical protein [Colwellia]|uniref:RiboL-PSP-HEPN domain-containing protein n=1 Tax=Colwellia marinimaniae TaxID=1513592 RepID=A0ABQ0MWH3_9GAMM|nr:MULTISPECIES: hypothetical protein [Colwellia]GAW96688.1 hypothetical protein MTCD1_02308 [Colwellia marinimaniae]